LDLIDKYRIRSEIAKAVAHPARMQIIDILSQEGPQTVTELTDRLQVSQPTVSGYLAVLRNAGIVTFTKEGAQAKYRVRTPCIVDLFDCLDAVVRSHLKQTQEQFDTEMREAN